MADIKQSLTRAIWWVRHRTTDRFHIINISGMDGYKKGWIDRDHVMELACWKLLCDFVEKESPDIGIGGIEVYTRGWEPSETELEIIKQQYASDLEIRELYTWWTQTRPVERKAHENMLADDWYARRDDPAVQAAFDVWNVERDRLEDVDDMMLRRLIKIRKHLWT